MNRVLIIGNIASGKSTFAKKLHKLTELELIHLDNLFYNEDGTYKQVEEWVRIVKQTVQKDNWIIDGNYPHTLTIRAHEADTLFLFDLPRILCILYLLKRYFYCSILKKERDDCPQLPINIFKTIKKIWGFKMKKKRFYDEILLMDRKLIYYFKSKKEIAGYLKTFSIKKETDAGLLSGTVRLEKSTVRWQQMYKAEYTKLRKIFKSNDILIEHIGSTAIPDIEAKPIIDILIVVPVETDMDNIIRKLILGGYYKSSFKLADEVFLKKTDGVRSTHYLHLAKHSQGDWQRYILFRDYLIRNPHVAKEYEDLKKELAKKYANDRVAYTSEKKVYIDKIFREISNYK